ncbi:MAG: tetratricopeptide repeat protein [Deltaproteobacteria bacterium]|nr:tetratricopeptide repeat protein [Deltaproteobacteria bacterium]
MGIENLPLPIQKERSVSCHQTRSEIMRPIVRLILWMLSLAILASIPPLQVSALAVQSQRDLFIDQQTAPLTDMAQAAVVAENPPAPTALSHFADGVEALDLDDLDGAVRSFKMAIQMEPNNLEFRYYLAVTYVRMSRYEEALRIFRQLIEISPENYFKAYFDIAGVYSRQEQYEEALKVLNGAEKQRPENARVYLEKGYVYKNLGDYDLAIKSFTLARELDPKETQLSYFMVGAVELERESFEEAETLFKKAIEVAPDTPLAESARQTLPAVENAAWVRKPWYLTTAFNWGYDDNVPRDPLEELTGRPAGLPSNAGDQFETFLLRGGYKVLNQKEMEAGIGYSLFSIGYRDWTDNNVTSHNPHVYFQGDFNPVFFRFQYDFSYFYAGGKKQDINPPLYLTFANNSEARMRMHSFTPTISILEPYDLRTDINFGYQIKEYLDGITKDASRYAADITQSYKLPGTEVYPRIGYRYAYEHSGDDPSTYRYHEVFAGISTPIYWGVRGDVAFSYMRTAYPDFSPSKERLDQSYTLNVSISRTFFDRLYCVFMYLHLKNDSDYLVDGQDVYTFRKNMYIVSITYTF